MRINGIDYDARADDLVGMGIDLWGDDDTPFGDEVFCNQHRRRHSTGWCTAANVEKRGISEGPFPVLGETDGGEDR